MEINSYYINLFCEVTSISAPSLRCQFIKKIKDWFDKHDQKLWISFCNHLGFHAGINFLSSNKKTKVAFITELAEIMFSEDQTWLIEPSSYQLEKLPVIALASYNKNINVQTLDLILNHLKNFQTTDLYSIECQLNIAIQLCLNHKLMLPQCYLDLFKKVFMALNGVVNNENAILTNQLFAGSSEDIERF